MKQWRYCLVLAGVTACLPASASAETVQKHQKHQEKRIEKGERKGQITDEEAAKLDQKQDAIQTERDEAWADGKMTKNERKSVRHEQKEANQSIHHMRHNPKGKKKQ